MSVLPSTDPQAPRRVAIYIRVSTDEQKVDGYGLEAQRKRLLEYVRGNPGLNLMTKDEWIFEDTHTGSDLNRSALKELREAVKKGEFDAVLVWKIDRLSRSLQHLLAVFEELTENSVSFMSLQENLDFKGPIGMLIFQIFGAIAQFERELIKGRTRSGRIVSAEMGNFTGTAIPYGYRPIPNPTGKGKLLELIPDERDWVVKMFEWYIYENMGYGQVASRLNDLRVTRGVHRKRKDRGTKWTPKMTQTIIENPIYRGEFVANNKDENNRLLPSEEWTVVAFPACVSSLMFRQAEEALENRTGGKKNTDYLLTGKLKDMTLPIPKTFVGAKRTKGGYSYRRKQFDTPEGHVPVFEIPAAAIEDYVWGRVMKMLKDPEAFIKHYLSEVTVDQKRMTHLENTLPRLRARLSNIDLEEARVRLAYEVGDYSLDAMSEALRDKSKEKVAVESQIQALEDELALAASIDMEVGRLKDASKKVKYRLEHLATQQKKILCNLFVDRVEMTRTMQGNGKWDIRADVHFRFNPDHLAAGVVGGRTETNLEKTPKQAKNSNNGRSGGT